jgi:hypothetical protein
MSESDELRRSEQFTKSMNLRETDLTFFGDRATIVNVVTLLSYIRHAVMNHEDSEITVKIGKTRGDAEFEFTVNNMKTGDLITKNELEIS